MYLQPVMDRRACLLLRGLEVSKEYPSPRIFCHVYDVSGMVDRDAQSIGLAHIWFQGGHEVFVCFAVQFDQTFQYGPERRLCITPLPVVILHYTHGRNQEVEKGKLR